MKDIIGYSVLGSVVMFMIFILWIMLFYGIREVYRELFGKSEFDVLAWDNIVSIERHPRRKNNYIVTFKDGWQVIGESNVWYTYPGFTNCPTEIDEKMGQIWERFSHEGFNGFFPETLI